MAGLVKLAIDRQSKTLVEFNGSVIDLPPLYQISKQQFQIQVVEATGSLIAPYDVVDCSASELRALVAAQVTGDESDNASQLLAATYEAGWAWDSGLEAFLGLIDFHTAEVAAHLGPDSSKSAVLEFNLMTGGEPETIFGCRSGQTNLIINANADDGSSTAPSIIENAETVGTKTIQHGVGGVTIADDVVVTVSGLGLAGAPANVFLFIQAPSGSGNIGANVIVGSATSDHFSFVLSAIPPNNNYKVTYVLTF